MPTSRWRLAALIGIAFASFALLDLSFGGPVTTRAPHLASRLPSYDELTSGLPSYDELVDRLPTLWPSFGDSDGDEDKLVTTEEIDAAYAADGGSSEDGEASEVFAAPATDDTALQHPSCSPETFDAGAWIERAEPHPEPTCRWYGELREAPRRASA